MVPLRNSAIGGVVLVGHLHVLQRALSLKWSITQKRKCHKTGKRCVKIILPIKMDKCAHC